MLLRVSVVLFLALHLGPILVGVLVIADSILGFRHQALIGLLLIPAFAGLVLGSLMLVLPRMYSEMNREAARRALTFGTRRRYHPVLYVACGLWYVFLGISLLFGGIAFGLGYVPA